MERGTRLGPSPDMRAPLTPPRLDIRRLPSLSGAATTSAVAVNSSSASTDTAPTTSGSDKSNGAAQWRGQWFKPALSAAALPTPIPPTRLRASASQPTVTFATNNNTSPAQPLPLPPPRPSPAPTVPPPVPAAADSTSPSPNPSKSRRCGHVFVLHCNAAGLAADSILIPIRDPDNAPALGSVRALTPAEIEQAGHSGAPNVFEGQITTRLYSEEREAIEGTMGVVASYLDAAGRHLAGTTSAFHRAKPLIALPCPGVGLMDVSDLIKEMKDIVRPLLLRLYRTAEAYDVDVALCTIDAGAHNVAQVLRTDVCPFRGGPFWMLPEQMRREASRLQELAAQGRLGVLFGAGVSLSSGLPSWAGLLEQLAIRAGLDAPSREALRALDYLDQATLIEESFGGGLAFKRAVADCVQHGRYTPTHAIVGALRVPAVTTNYDPLYERAVDSAAADEEEEKAHKLPWDAGLVARMPSSCRRILKLHGCVTDPGSIVLTRADFMRYEDTRRALRGLLHQNLLERELLVIGFSMTDDNVHLIIDQVRKVLDFHKLPGGGPAHDPHETASGAQQPSSGTRQQQPLPRRQSLVQPASQSAGGPAPAKQPPARGGFSMGTIVSLVENVMFRRLWERDFTVLSMGDTWADEPQWLHDCWLDYLSAGLIVRKAASSFVLDPAYTDILSPMQRQIKQALDPLLALLGDADAARQADGGGAATWARVEEWLREFGAPNLAPNAAKEHY